MPNTHSGYQPLLEGAAGLGLLLGTLGLPWPALLPFVGDLAEPLNRYLELSLDGPGGTLGVMTKGQGQDFTFQVARILERLGPAEEAVRDLLVTARYFEHRGVHVKLDVDAAGPREVTWYVRRRPGLDVVQAWLAGRGVSEAARAQLGQVAAALDKRSALFLACSLDRAGVLSRKVYFTQPPDPASPARIDAALAALGLGGPLPPHWTAEVAARDAFLGVRLGPEGLMRTATLYLHRVPTALAGAFMAEAGLTGEPVERMGLLASVSPKADLDYLGLHLTAAGLTGTKGYVFMQQG